LVHNAFMQWGGSAAHGFIFTRLDALDGVYIGSIPVCRNFKFSFFSEVTLSLFSSRAGAGQRDKRIFPFLAVTLALVSNRSTGAIPATTKKGNPHKRCLRYN